MTQDDSNPDSIKSNEPEPNKQLFKFYAYIPLKIISEANDHTHWRNRQQRAKMQRQVINAIWNIHQPIIILPNIIRLTRIAPRKLDDDNLVSSLKFCRDAIADLLIPGLKRGRADGDPRLKFEYAQQSRNKGEYALVIEIY